MGLPLLFRCFILWAKLNLWPISLSCATTYDISYWTICLETALSYLVIASPQVSISLRTDLCSENALEPHRNRTKGPSWSKAKSFSWCWRPLNLNAALYTWSFILLRKTSGSKIFDILANATTPWSGLPFGFSKSSSSSWFLFDQILHFL